MIKSIIFDFDGVIHDTFEIGFRLNKIVNPDITEGEYRDFFNGNLYEHKKGITPVRIEKFFELQEKEFEALMIEEEIKQELLKLKKKYKLFIVTSNKEGTLKKYFERSNLSNLFDEILGIETHTSKEEKFKLMFERNKLNKEECIFITDTLGDLLEAQRFGIKTIAVDYGFHDVERLKKGNPIKIISHIKEIEGLL
ncbi:MAG: HAD-IA family hydrolase [archaeon]